MVRSLHLLIVLGLCCLSAGVAGQEVQEIPPGMSRRPTPECGGAPMMALWEAERIERLEGIASAAVAAWMHGLEPRLVAAATAVERDLIEATRRRYEACLATRTPRDAVCVAAAAGRAELCDVEADPYKRDMCRLVTTATVASAGRDPAPCELLETAGRRDACVHRSTGLLRCTGDPALCLLGAWLTPGSCRIPGILTSWVTPLRFLCRWILWIEAARGAGGCEEGLGDGWRDGCQAVAARAPEACPPPGRHEAGIALDSDCRDDAVARLLSPRVQHAPGRVTLSVTLFNPFREAARCVLHLQAMGPIGPAARVTTASFELAGNARAWRGQTVPLDLRISPAEPSWTWSVRPDCTFSLHVLEGAGEAGAGAVATFDG
jgi:hypothetical protein